MSIYNWVSLSGLLVLMVVAWLCSDDRRAPNWRVMAWGLGLQLAFGFAVFRLQIGQTVFRWANDAVVKVVGAASAGSLFVFGRLAVPPGSSNATGEPSLGFFLAFQAFPTIVFFSALMAILYHARVMPLLIRGFASVFTRLMRVSGAESLCVSSNIFVGIESMLTVRPHLADMTRSELCTILTAGMATVASNVMAVYVFSLQSVFPAVAGHLISASILSAPAALLMSKLLVPERGVPKTMGMAVDPHYERDGSVFEAVIRGANDGVKLVAGIVALLLAVMGLMALVDLVMDGVGARVNDWLGWEIDWSLKGLLAYLFHPFAVVMGVPLSEAGAVAKLIGERAILTEVVAYQDLAVMIRDRIVSDRSAVIASYALCGFAHVASMAIFVGGTAALAPGQTRVLARLGLRALLAATLACLMTGCVAGFFFTGQSVLFGAPR